MKQLLKNGTVFQLAVFQGNFSQNEYSVANRNDLLNDTGFADV